MGVALRMALDERGGLFAWPTQAFTADDVESARLLNQGMALKQGQRAIRVCLMRVWRLWRAVSHVDSRRFVSTFRIALPVCSWPRSAPGGLDTIH